MRNNPRLVVMIIVVRVIVTEDNKAQLIRSASQRIKDDQPGDQAVQRGAFQDAGEFFRPQWEQGL